MSSRTRDLALLAAFTLLLHAPFLTRPFHNDEVNYLDIASNVFDHPLTPLNFTYIFQGIHVDMAGHPHPPLIAYVLAGLWSLRGWASPVFFHFVFLIFPLAIAWSAYFVARNFLDDRGALWAALFVSAAPAVVVAANSVETDSPALAFLLAGAAFFLARRWIPAGILFSLAGCTALQTLPVIAILAAYEYLRIRHSKEKFLAPAIAAAAPFVVLALWQVSQMILMGRAPAAKLAGYAMYPAYFNVAAKLGSAVTLVGHLGMTIVVAPFRLTWRKFIYPWLLLIPWSWPGDYAPWQRALLFGFVVLGLETAWWIGTQVRDQPMLSLWCLLYFAFALGAFFAGSARYLMPLAAPLAILFVRQNHDRPWRLGATLAIGAFLAVNLAFADAELARVYAELPPPPGEDFLVDGEWGFRYAMTRHGGKPIDPSSAARPGEWIVKSDLIGGDFDSPAETLAVPVESRDLEIRTPFRVIDRNLPGFAHSGFESSGFGWLPFSFSERPIEHITYSLDSPFLNTDGWTPTRIGGRLVFLTQPNRDVTVPADPRWQACRLTLYARGRGPVTFLAPPHFAEQVSVENELRHAESFSTMGEKQMLFRIDAPPGVQVGWEELVCY